VALVVASALLASCNFGPSRAPSPSTSTGGNFQRAPELEGAGISDSDPYAAQIAPAAPYAADAHCDGFTLYGGTDYGAEPALAGLNNPGNHTMPPDPCH